MPAPRTTTPGEARVRALADRAKELPDGLRVRFTIANHHTLADCASAARSFQTSFSSMRAKARRKTETLQEREKRDVNAKGPYDSLACIKERLANDEGYAIWLAPAYAIDFANDVVDGKTGEPLAEYDPINMKSNAILQFWLARADEARRGKAEFRNPLDADQEAWMFEHQPEIAEDMYRAAGFKSPAEREAEMQGGMDALAKLDPSADIWGDDNG